MVFNEFWLFIQSDIADVPNDSWRRSKKRRVNPAALTPQKDSERSRAALGQNMVICSKEGNYKSKNSVNICMSRNTGRCDPV